jgi:hypothetical protein
MATNDESDLPSLADLEEKLLNARCRLMTREPWYGHIAMAMEWIPSQMLWEDDERSKTMGVRIVNGGVVQCVWYPKFVHSQTIQELYGVVMHEIEHIVRCHCLRIGPGRDPMQWNVACDMIVNGRKSKPICAYYDPALNDHILPIDGNGVYLPEDWETGQTTEQIYEKIGGVYQKCPKCGGALKRNQSSGGQKGKGGQGKQGQQNGSSGQSGKQGQQGQQNGSGGSGSQQGPHTCPGCGGACCPHVKPSQTPVNTNPVAMVANKWTPTQLGVKPTSVKMKRDNW